MSKFQGVEISSFAGSGSSVRSGFQTFPLLEKCLIGMLSEAGFTEVSRRIV